MRLIFCLFTVSLALGSCNMNAEKDAHLPKEKMQQILLDINLAEAYSTMAKDSLHKTGAKNIDSLAAYYTAIFRHHKITQQQFQSSLAWYKLHPNDMDSLFNNIMPVVTKLQTPAK